MVLSNLDSRLRGNDGGVINAGSGTKLDRRLRENDLFYH
jgi:hypothetical protein